MRPAYERLAQEVPYQLQSLSPVLGVQLESSQVILNLRWGKESLAQAMESPRSLAYLSWCFREWEDGQPYYLLRVLDLSTPRDVPAGLRDRIGTGKSGTANTKWTRRRAKSESGAN